MPQNTQRPRYFDGEFLRSGDFTDEQSYHIGMRRLLNQEFDRSGIVRGLEIVQDQNSVPSPPPALSSQSATSPSSQSLALPVSFYSVTPGFAIDQIGREISVSAPYSMTPLLSRAGVTNAWYELWIVYTETMSGSPAPGYQLCNQLSQNTRWDESFDLVLRPLGVAPDPNVPDPNHDLKGLCLAVLQVVSSSISGLQFFVPSDYYRRRRYARIRAQSIIAPDQIAHDHVILIGPNVFPPHGYIHMETPNGVYSEGSLVVRKDLLVGDDWTIQNTVGPPPAPTNPNGNLKLNSDIFMNGQIYTNVKGNWTPLGASVQSTIPDVKLIPPQRFLGLGTSSTVNSTQSLTINQASNLPNLAPTTQIDVQWFITSYSFVSPTDISNWLTNSGAIVSAPEITITFTAPPTFVAPNQVTFTVQCNVGGGWGPALGLWNFLIDSVDVAFVAVFRP